MKINIFYKRRREANIDITDMATELGLNPKVYEEIERDLRPMPTNLVDKFFAIIKKAKDEPNKQKLERVQKEVEVNEFFDELMANDRAKLLNYMEKFNIKNFVELGNLLGYAPSTISNYTKAPNLANYEFKNKFYTFFNDELNIQIKNEESVKEEKPSIYTADLVMSENEAEEIKNKIRSCGYNLTAFGAEFGIPGSTVSHILNGRPHSQKTRSKLDEALSKMEENKPSTLDVQEIIATEELTIGNEIKVDNFTFINDENGLICTPNTDTDIIKFNEIEEEMIEKKEIPMESNMNNYYVEKETVEETLESLTERREKVVDDLIFLNDKIREKEEIEERMEEADEMAKSLAIYRDALLNNGFSEEFFEKLVLTCLK